MAFYRTLRVPDDGRLYPLPPGLGQFPIHSIADLGDRAPESWRREGGIVLPLYQSEALWIGFLAAAWKPNAVKVGVGKIDALTGRAWDLHLSASPQNYLVCPDQPWLDGFHVGPNQVRQFVAMPLGSGYTVESQLSGEEEEGGIRLAIFEPKPGRFPDAPPAEGMTVLSEERGSLHRADEAELGLAAGGTISQKIYPDRYGLDVWSEEKPALCGFFAW